MGTPTNNDTGPAAGLFNFMGGTGPETQQQPNRNVPPGLEKFTPEQLLDFADRMQKGEYPPELQAIFGQVADADGKPIIDAEGGATV